MLFIHLSLHRKKEENLHFYVIIHARGCPSSPWWGYLEMWSNWWDNWLDTHSRVFSRLEAFCFYCTYVLLGYGAAADTRFRKAEGNHVVSNSWLLLRWFFQHFLSMPLPQKKYFSSIFPSLVSSWIWNVPVIEPVIFSENFGNCSRFLYWTMIFSVLEEWSYTVRIQPVPAASLQRPLL